MTRPDIFATTHPSLVERLFDREPATRETAWSDFVRRYEEPIALCLRGLLRRAPSWAPAVEDLTGSFFGVLLAGDVLEKWDQQRGPLRAYVQGVLRRFVASALREHAPLAHGQSVDPDGLMSPEDEVTADFERRWAYQVFILALGNLARSHREAAETWIELEGLTTLVADRAHWVFASYDEAIAAQGAPPVPARGAEALATSAGVTIGTMHNRKYKANTMLLGYIAVEVRRYGDAPSVVDSMDRFFELMQPLVPRLALLRQRAAAPRDGGGGSASKRE